MGRPSHRDTLDRSDPGGVLVADLTLRFDDVRLPGHVYWPRPTAVPSPLVLFLEGGEATALRASADTVCRLLCSAAAVVLAVAAPPPGAAAAGDAYEGAALAWAAEHAAELGGRPDRLLLAGDRAGAARAAWLAIAARDCGWPQIHRQVLVHPTFTPALPAPPRVAGAAPATIVSGCGDDGSRYAARLRASGVEVDELPQAPRTPFRLRRVL
jgi:acetyl esterase/lipase